MYEPSNNFYTDVIQNQVRRVNWSGTITNGTSYSFSAKDIISGEIINEASGSNMEIGTVYSSELNISLYVDEIGIPRNKIYGAEISLFCTMTANGTSGIIPMGVFTVVEATQKGQICSITAYDNMSLFDREFPITSGMASPYEWLLLLCGDCNVTLGNTVNEIESLPNGSYKLSMNWTDDANTYREVLAQLVAALGSSAHMDRNGNLVLLQLTNGNSVATIKANDRFDSDIAHTTWSPSSFFVTNKETGAVSSAGSGQLAFNLGDNAFLQGPGYTYDEITNELTGTYSVNDMLTNIYNSARTLSVVPIEAEIPLDPCLDLFDVVTLTGGQANNTKVFITSLTHSIGGASEIKCAGANTTEESSISSRGSSGSKDDWLWVSGAINSGTKVAITTSQTWGDVLPKTWDEIRASTWGELYNGGSWVLLEYFERYFNQDLNLGVIGLTTNYQVDKDTNVRFKITIEKMVGISWTQMSQWTCNEYALRGYHTTTLVAPFGILNNSDALYRISAYMSGFDFDDEDTILTKSEIEALISGGESS